jgi:HD-like signal output (HDOD) protein
MRMETISSDPAATRRPSILFVDDEQAILDGLAAALRRQRKIWDMQFICGGAAALGLLEAGRFDIIVSDMRMPGLDGEGLLTAARSRCPGAVRVLLSGQTEPAALLRSVRLAHRFHAKPCSVSELRASLEQLLVLASSMEGRRELVCSIDRLPLSAEALAQAQTAVDAAGFELTGVARALEPHPAIVADLLRAAGAGYFAPPQHIESVEAALRVLGGETVRALVHSMAVHKKDPQLERSQAHAVASGRLLKKMRPEVNAQLTGELHALGELVLAVSEKPRGELSHSDVAADLLLLWGADPAVAEAIRQVGKAALPEGASELMLLLRAACALTGGSTPLDLTSLAALGLDAQVPQWRAWAAALRENPILLAS